MRICPVSIAQPSTNLRNVKKSQTSPNVMPSAMSFKGWKAGLGSLVGTGLGIAVGTVLSGGLLVPFIIGGAGSIAGGIYGSSKEEYKDDGLPDYDDSDPDWHIHGD